MQDTNVQTTDFRSTKDIYYASYLTLCGIELFDTEVEGGTIFFRFRNSPELEKRTVEYYTQVAKIEPLAYLSKLKRLRQIVRKKLNGNTDFGGAG